MGRTSCETTSIIQYGLPLLCAHICRLTFREASIVYSSIKMSNATLLRRLLMQMRPFKVLPGRPITSRVSVSVHSYPRQFSGIVEHIDDAAWKEMTEKSRSLATLISEGDECEDTGPEANSRDAHQRRKKHIFNRRRGLSQAITMIESGKESHQHESKLLLTYLLNHENNHKRKTASFRLGIAGAPGAGEFDGNNDLRVRSLWCI